MNLAAYQMNTQYLRTELKYQATISPVNSTKEGNLIANETNKKDSVEDSNIQSSLVNAPVIYANESDLSNIDILTKLLMENILGTFNPENVPESLFPNENMNMTKESYGDKNPYAKDMTNMPQGFLYSSNYEYYEKTTFEFNAQATIKTPNGEYNIELKFSYTKEFYEKNETQIAVANENFKTPLEIILDKDDESLKDIYTQQNL